MDKFKKKKLEEQEHKRRKANVDKLLKDYCYEHKYPTTRREFISSGLITFGAAATIPSLLLGPNAAMAQADECAPADGGAGGMPAFITVALGGGAMFAGNMQYGDAGGQPLQSYRSVGQGANPGTTVQMGAPFWNQGLIIQGIMETASAAALANSRLVGVPLRSIDDTSRNEMDASGMVLAAGLSGQFLPNLGSDNSMAGARHNPANINPTTALRVNRQSDLENAVSLNGALGQLSSNQAGKLLKLVQELSENQGLANAQRNPASANLAKLVKCATAQNTDLIANGLNVDFRADAEVQRIWQIAANTDPRRNNNPDDQGNRAMAANMVKAALQGLASSVGLTFGGYDYHLGANRTTANQRDLNAGRMIGRIIEQAHSDSKKAFLYINSDGATSTREEDDSDSADWRGDIGSKGSVWMIAYDPAGRPESLAPAGTPAFQIGQFTETQNADTNYMTGNNPALAAAAVFANYMSFSGRTGMIESVIPGVFNSAQIDEILRIGDKPSA